MDYSGILKRAWNVTWKHKILWLFGLFAGAMGGGGSYRGGGNSGGSGTGTGTGNLPVGNAAQAQRFLEQSLPLIIALLVLLLLIGIVWWVLSVAARGGIVHLVNEAEENRPVRAGDGWRVGFSKWGRVFGIRFLTGLPIFLVVAVFVGVIVVTAIGGAAGTAASRGDSSGTAAAVISIVSGMCCFIFLFFVVLVVLGVVLSIISELAVRYAVLRDTRVMDSLRLGWADLRGKRGAFIMYLIQWGISIAYSIVLVIVALILIGPAVFLMIAGAWIPGVLLVLVGLLVLMLPAAVYGAFYHAVWTIFFRRMTGLEPRAAAAIAGPGVPPSGGMYPPPPPSGTGVPPAPGVAPAPWESQVSASPGGPPADPWVSANSLPDTPSPAIPEPAEPAQAPPEDTASGQG